MHYMRAYNKIALFEKLVYMFASASEDDLIKANEMLSRIDARTKGSRFSFRFPTGDRHEEH